MKTRTTARKRKTSVASLFGAAPLIPQQVPEVVSRLEYLLARARDGLILGFAHAAVESSGTIDWGWTGKAEVQRMQAAVGRLNHSIFSQEE